MWLPHSNLLCLDWNNLLSVVYHTTEESTSNLSNFVHLGFTLAVHSFCAKQGFFDEDNVFIELPRFVKGEKECETIYDKWIYILKNLDTMETMPFAEERNAAFAKLAARAAQANMTPAERAAYEESRKNLWDYYNTIDTAVEEGRAEARAEGRAEGVESTQRKAVLKMHSKGYSVSECV